MTCFRITRVVCATTLILLLASVAAAQISGVTVTKLAPGDADDVELDRLSTASLVSSSGTGFTARLSGVHVIDAEGSLSGVSDSQANDYQVEFTVNLPAYQLTIDTNYSGCARVVDDQLVLGSGNASPDATTGTVTLGPPLTTGTLDLTGLGSQTSDGEFCFNPTASATIVNASLAPVTHRLRFQLTNAVTSHDWEAAVKFGQSSVQSGQLAGTGTGTAVTDGHFVVVSLIPLATPTVNATPVDTGTPPDIGETATPNGNDTPTPAVTVTPADTITPVVTTTPLPGETATPTRTATVTPTKTITATTTPLNTGSPVLTPTPTATPVCAGAPIAGCRTPAVPRKALLVINDKGKDEKDTLVWKWVKGSTTTKDDFGTPTTTTGYNLCIYDGTSKVIVAAAMPNAGICNMSSPRRCWIEQVKGYDYHDKDLTPDGVQKVLLRQGLSPGSARIVLKARGALLDDVMLPVVQPLRVQLVNTEGVCWEATYSAPARVNTGGFSAKFKDKAD